MNQEKPQLRKRGTPDFQLLILTFLLVGFGLVMVFSASSSLTISSSKFNNDPLYFTKKQFVWALLGTIVMFIAMNIHYSKYKKLFVPMFFVTVVMLAIVPFTKSVNGARSWLGVAGMGIQPTELAKITIILYLSALIVKKGERFRDLRTGYIPVMVIVGFVAGLIMMQPDLGSTMILVATSAIIIYAGGASLKHMLASAALLILGASLVLGANYLIKSITHSDSAQEQSGSNYKVGRITAWIDPYQDEKGDGYNLIQSLTAIGNGQVTGAGFGKSIQKLNYIKNPYNDFIFPVMAEEFGFIGTSLFLLIYIYFIWRGILIALRCTDPFGTLVGIGIMGLFAIQAFVNIGGVSQTIPLTGVTLPFISYGGTSLLIMMFSMGIMLSISRQVNLPAQQEVVKSVNIKRDYRRSV